ncbi:membrane protein [Skermanella stibiiresistens SB22]|uniref:TRAP transporter large permease protein n=1 Tax=Skermanella stibiiresistens SB22 TaxID=1385369 RepID=W9GYW2_9PROT|nr:TRAP transporter large permease [Skermanella stibiiresistens]EWY37801.1 membrane protein [Skermanella stibiiresistens SB22]
MTVAIAVIALLALIAAGIHVAIALGIIAAGLMLISFNIPPILIAQTAWGSIDSYALVAIPFFIFSGNLMSRGNLALVIMNLVASVVRCFKGGVALALAISSMFFAAVNGSSVACAVALGPAAVRLLPAEGYSPRFSAALIAVCGTLGLMIPPSLSFILIGSIVGMPIPDLFIAGIIPGLLELTLLATGTVVLSRRYGFGIQQDKPDWKAFRKALPSASGALLMPVLIIGTIYAGLFTPTEVSALAAIYAAVLVLLVYRTANLFAIWQTLQESVKQTVMIYGILLGSGLLTAMLTRLGLAAELTRFVAEANVSPFVFLLTVNILLIIVGMFLDGVSMIVLLSPILFPLATAVDINPVHFAVILTALVEIATLTPPVGLNLFVMSKITKLPVHEIIQGVLPFYGIRLVGLVLINAVPQLSLALL